MGFSSGSGSSQQSGWGYGYGVNQAESQSRARDVAQQNIWGGQSPYLTNLYGQGQNLVQDQSNLQQTAQGIADPLLQQGQQAIQGLGMAGSNIVESGLQALETDLGNFYNRQLLPGIQSDAIGAGQLGGSRQGIAQGLAAGGVADAYAQGAADIYQQGGAQQIAANQAVIQGASALYNLGMSPYQAAWAPLQSQAALLGDPRVLATSLGMSDQFSRALGVSEDFRETQGSSEFNRMGFNFGPLF